MKTFFKTAVRPLSGWSVRPLVSKAVGTILLGSVVFSGVCSFAQAPVVSAGTVNVGSTSVPVVVTVTMTASGVAAAPVVVTQGITGMDFAVGAGGTCASGATYSVGQQCTMAVTFTPKYPGPRSGAVEIVSGSGALLGEAFVAGTGVGPLSVLMPGRIDTVAGNGDWTYRNDGVSATIAPIFLPNAVVTDAAGNIFLSDSNNNRLRRVDGATGIITTVAGNGSPGFSGDNGAATQAMISSPAGLALDGAGNLYFADTGNDAVRRVDAVTGVITTVAGMGGKQGYSGDGAAANLAKLSLPQGIAFDAAGNLYIADTSNHVIREVSALDGTIATIAGTGTAGYNGDNQTAVTAKLNTPWNLTIAPDGSIYIADLQNYRVRKITLGTITTVVGDGNPAFAGDGGPATQAELNQPASVVMDPAGNLYVADSGNNRIRLVSATTHTITTIAGTSGEQFAGDTGAANLASMYGPYALYFDQKGNLFLADMFHNRIRRINASALTLQYATIRVGKTSAPQSEGVMNAGNASLTLAAPGLVNAAADPVTTTCNTGLVMAVDDTCNIGVEFAPTVLGTAVVGTYAVKSDAGNSPLTITLIGDVLSVNPTSVSLTSSLNPSLVGNVVTFTATVASGGASPTGPVTFLDGTTTLCTVNLNAVYSATCTPASLALGSHNITASYAGDASDAASVSPVLVQVVKQPSTLTLVVSPNPVTVTATVTLTATATASTGTPTGTVTFYDGTTALGSGSLNSSGVATYTTTQLSAVTHTLTAQYVGDATNAASKSNAVNEVVQKAPTVTMISSSNADAAVGSPVTFTATVSTTSGPAPTGTVQFTDGATSLGSGTVGSNGTATLTTSTLTAGVHAIVATYVGDASDATSASSPLLETIEQIGTVTTLSSSANPANAGATIQLTANVSMAPGGTAFGTISGNVTFTYGTTTLGTAVVDASGNATISNSTLPVGLDGIVAAYAGNTSYASSTSAVLNQRINQTSTTTALISSNPNILAGKAVTFTATVTTATGKATGAVNFMDGAVNIGQGTLNAQSVATLTVSTLAVGSHTITAMYAGDSNYTGSTSAPLVETVSLATTALTLAGPSAPVDAGVAVVLTGTLTGNGLTPTGALTLRDGGVTIATQNAVPSGSFTFSTSTLAIGSHTLTVGYVGDAYNATATSNSLVVTIQSAPTTTSLSSSANPQVVGQSVTLSAAVTSGGPNLTGSVSFEDGGILLSSVALTANGTATYTTSSLAFGVHTLTAVYGGDSIHSTSTSPAISEQIVQAASASLSSSANPAVAGASVVFTVKLAGVGSVVPTGSVIFADGATTLGTVTLDATGAASFQSTTLAVGSHTILVSYTGDKNYSAATATLVETIQSANTQIGLTASANPAIYGTPLSITATITSNGGVPTGTVTFTEGSATVGSAVLNAGGVATLTISTLAPGTHSVIANYAGDGRASASVSTPLSLVVKELTSVSVASSANPSPTLASITFTAVVTNAGVGQPTGTVTFTDGGTQLGLGTVNASGTATLTVSSLSAGNHTILASYSGDGANFSGVSSSLTQGVQLRPTTTTLTASNTNANNPLQVTLIAVVRWTGPGTPTGSVSFVAGSATLGSSPVDSTGVATLTIVLQSSTLSLVAEYSGDTTYAGSNSAAVTVNGGQATQFSMQVNPSSITMASKQHQTITLTVTSIQGFADTLQLGCAGLPKAATCSFSTTAMKLTGGATATAQITVDTGDPLGAGASANLVTHDSSKTMLCFVPIGLLAGMLLFLKKKRTLPMLLMMLCAIGMTLGTTGCAGLQVNGTPAGTYSFKVTAQGEGSGVSESSTVTLTVTQ